MKPTLRSRSFASLLAGLLCSQLGLAGTLAGTGLLLAAAPAAHAEGEEGGPSIEEQIKEQMKKVIQLMKENEQAILEASRGSGKKPEGVQVTPPPDEGSATKPPPEGSTGKKPEGEAPPAKGQDIQKRMDELIKSTQSGGGMIPQELEQLIRMIPKGKCQGCGTGDGEPQSSSRKRDLPNPDDPMGKKDKDGEPKDPRKNPEDARGGNKPPPESEKEKSRQPEVPSWMAELPEEARRAIIGGDTENVPDRYRGLIERYHKWIADQLKERAP